MDLICKENLIVELGHGGSISNVNLIVDLGSVDPISNEDRIRELARVDLISKVTQIGDLGKVDLISKVDLSTNWYLLPSNKVVQSTNEHLLLAWNCQGNWAKLIWAFLGHDRMNSEEAVLL